MTIYDHTQSPPARHTATGSCLTVPGFGAVPVSNLPPGLYEDGGTDPIPAGYRATGWERIVRDGKSVRVATGTEPIPIPEPTPVPANVLTAAAALAADAAALNAEFAGLNLDLADGYRETYDAIFGSGSVVPVADQARVWARVDTAYRTLEYHTAKWQAGALAWDLLPQIASALAEQNAE